MNVILDDKKIKFKDTIEEFFTFENKRYHELFFVYEYDMDEEMYQKLLNVKENQDNHITDYIFVGYDEFDKVVLLPYEVRELIKR